MRRDSPPGESLGIRRETREVEAEEVASSVVLHPLEDHRGGNAHGNPRLEHHLRLGKADDDSHKLLETGSGGPLGEWLLAIEGGRREALAGSPIGARAPGGAPVSASTAVAALEK